MKLNKKGIAHLGLIIGIVVFAVIIIIGVLVYKSNKKDDTQENQQATVEVQQQPATDETDNIEKISAEITKLPKAITLKSPDDVSKLPEGIPNSFIDFLTGRLANNNPDEFNCITEFSVSKISSINIAGSLSSVSASGSNDACGGGAALVWYLKDGTWHEVGFQSYMGCKQIIDTTIAIEFMESCYDDKKGTTLPNPNGTLQQVIDNL